MMLVMDSIISGAADRIQARAIRQAAEQEAEGDLISHQFGDKSKSDSNPKGAGRKESGTAAASRELNISDTQARRAKKIASMTPGAKSAAADAGMSDHQRTSQTS